MFHYNKKHNEDPKLYPPWVVKFKGESFYVRHITISPGCGFSTKETPDSEHTKASIQVKGRLFLENDEAIIEAT